MEEFATTAAAVCSAGVMPATAREDMAGHKQMYNYIGLLWGLYRGFFGASMGIMEKKMEATLLCSKRVCGNF